MSQLLIFLFVLSLLCIPLLTGTLLKLLLNRLNPSYLYAVSIPSVRLVAQVVCVLGAVVAILLSQSQLFSHAASLIAGALLFGPGLLILSLIKMDGAIGQENAADTFDLETEVIHKTSANTTL